MELGQEISANGSTTGRCCRATPSRHASGRTSWRHDLACARLQRRARVGVDSCARCTWFCFRHAVAVFRTELTRAAKAHGFEIRGMGMGKSAYSAEELQFMQGLIDENKFYSEVA